jgi:hypothetical protein
MTRSSFNARSVAPLLLSLLIVLALAAGLRYGLVEAGRLPADCGGSLAEGRGFACAFKCALVQSFLHQRLGWASLVFAIAALISGRRGLAWPGWCLGLAGLVLYGFEPAAAAGLISLLRLLLLRRGPQGGAARASPTSSQPIAWVLAARLASGR